MPTFTAKTVMELRQRTGAGMMDCKQALTDASGDIEAAIDLMRASGAAKAAKKAGRIASEGSVAINISADQKTATILEVNSETDFVTKSADFIDFVNNLGELALKTEPANLDDFMAQKMDEFASLTDATAAIIAKVGENINIRRIKTIKTDGIIGSYIHGTKIAVLVVLNGKDEVSTKSDLAKDIAMHIAAIKPECITKDQVPAELIEREKAIFTEQAQKSGKPDHIIAKMLEGKVQKFLNEVSLYNQTFVKNPDTTIAQLAKANNIEVTNFTRFEVGEGIEKKADDFVQEVMAQAKS